MCSKLKTDTGFASEKKGFIAGCQARDIGDSFSNPPPVRVGIVCTLRIELSECPGHVG